MKGGRQSGVGAGKEDRVLRQPLERRVFGQRQGLLKPRLRAAAAIKLAGAGHGDQGMAIGINGRANGELIAADDAAGRMKQIEVAGLCFGIKRALNGEGTDMATGGERGFPAEKLKLEVQRGLPAFFILC